MPAYVCECETSISQRAGIVWRESQGTVIRGDCLFETAELRQGHATVVQRYRIFRLQCKNLVECSQCLLVQSEPV